MISRPLELPTQRTLDELRQISQSHGDPAMRTIATVLSSLAVSVESIADLLPMLPDADRISRSDLDDTPPNKPVIH